MRLRCPACGISISLDALLANEDAREFCALALRIPAEVGRMTLAYLGMHRPPKHALGWNRALALISEIAGGIEAGRIERHGRMWPAPVEAWRYAMEQMIAGRANLGLPLKGNGYLLEMICRQGNQAEAAAETKLEEGRKQAAFARGKASEPERVAKVIPRDVASQLKQFASHKGVSDDANDDTGDE